MSSAGRTVTLVLVDPAGEPLGTLPPFDTKLPWWADATEIVEAVRDGYGVDVTVLRILRTDPGPPHGRRCTYLASTDKPIPEAVVTGDVPELDDHPLRAPWARPGGPEKILAWAGERMAAIGRPVLHAEQQRTWNLSAIWRLDTPTGPAWLKVVPPFFAHEPAVLSWLHRAVPGRAPVPLVGAPGRVIMDRVSGDDQYDASCAERTGMAVDLVGIQAKALGAVEELRALRVPYVGYAELKAAATDVVARRGGEVSRRAAGEPPADALTALAALIDGLDDRLAAVEACGLPMTLSHGDFHAGNVRGTGPDRVILDWGDAVIGHPGFDLLRITEGLPPDDAREIRAAWSLEWRKVVPGCDPDRAVDLLRPVAGLRDAVMYEAFLDNIEPTEWPYHHLDVLTGLVAAARLVCDPVNLEKVIFGFFVLLAATLNFGFFIGDLSDPAVHNVYELFAAVVINLIATVLKFGDRTQIGAVHLATSLVASLQLIAATIFWAIAEHISSAGMTGEATAGIVSLSGGALFANVVSVILLVIETVSFQRR